MSQVTMAKVQVPETDIENHARQQRSRAHTRWPGRLVRQAVVETAMTEMRHVGTFPRAAASAQWYLLDDPNRDELSLWAWAQDQDYDLGPLRRQLEQTLARAGLLIAREDRIRFARIEAVQAIDTPASGADGPERVPPAAVRRLAAVRTWAAVLIATYLETGDVAAADAVLDAGWWGRDGVSRGTRYAALQLDDGYSSEVEGDEYSPEQGIDDLTCSGEEGEVSGGEDDDLEAG